jgi:hypothetical protein
MNAIRERMNFFSFGEVRRIYISSPTRGCSLRG